MICNNNSKSDLVITNNKLEYLNRLEKHLEMNTEINTDLKKYFLTFPYPYMNGKLHLGHLYSLSKVDFMGYYKRLCGFNVLFPFGFHCTGMPISASAKKLQEELSGNKVDVSVIDILKQFGFNNPKPFIDPEHWIRTFPNYAQNTLRTFHAGIDWRRSFITTELNVYYDSFIRFQFRRLRAAKLLKFGKRYSIYCRIDNQACLDHDRRRGEGVKPIEVILKKINTNNGILLLRCKVTEKTYDDLERIVIGREEIFVKFSILNIVDNNLEDIKKVDNIKGNKKILDELIIEKVDKIILDKSIEKNMLVETKSTTIYIIEKLLYDNLVHQVDGIKEISKMTAEEVNFIIKNDKIPINLIDGISSRVILSREDSKPPIYEYKFLLRIKNEEKRLLETSGFVKVYEPEQKVISRSGDECVVSLLDQWYIDYGCADWKQAARKCLAQMELSSPTRLKFEEAIEWISKWGFSRSFGLGTRVPWDEKYLIDSLSDSTIYMSFYTFKHLLCNGLAGEDQIIPSNILGDDLWEFIYGDVMRSCNGNCRCIYESEDNELCGCISSNDSVVNESINHSSDNAVCGNNSSEKNISDNESFNLFNCNCNCVTYKLSERLLPYEKILKQCRNSLKYFYPVDLRVSGKDLIGNHLIFYIFNHVALFREQFWPRRIFTNGHLMLNSAKMSKSEGNFMSAEDALNKFGTSATRLCLASCGDTNEDANFEEENANACVLKLFSLAKKILENNDLNLNIDKSNTINLLLNRIPETYEEFIEILLAQSLSRNIKAAIEAYELMSYRDVVKYAFYESQHVVEQYFVMGGHETPFIALVYKTILQIIYPIVPSFSYSLLKNKYNGDLQLPKPFTDRVDAIAAFDYARTIINRIISSSKGRKECTLIVSTKYPNWKIDAMACIDTITAKWNKNTLENEISIDISNNNKIKKQKSEIISTLSTIFRNYRLNVDKSLKFAMDYFKDPSKYAIEFDEVIYLKLLRPFIEKHANISFKLEIGETGEPMKPNIIFY